MGLANEIVNSADSNHVSINRFGKNERQRYLPVGNAIKELVRRSDAELKQHPEGMQIPGSHQPWFLVPPSPLG
jgi:hypothetical protein